MNRFCLSLACSPPPHPSPLPSSLSTSIIPLVRPHLPHPYPPPSSLSSFLVSSLIHLTHLLLPHPRHPSPPPSVIRLIPPAYQSSYSSLFLFIPPHHLFSLSPSLLLFIIPLPHPSSSLNCELLLPTAKTLMIPHQAPTHVRVVNNDLTNKKTFSVSSTITTRITPSLTPGQLN